MKKEKATITLSYDEERLMALRLFLAEKKTQVEDELTKNLDALYDILTGLEHRGSRFALTMPGEDAPHEVRLYAQRIRDVFLDAGVQLAGEE